MGIPGEVEFAVKMQMVRQILARALDAGCRRGWVTVDEASGRSKSLRIWLEHRDVAYVIATCNDDMITPTTDSARANELSLQCEVHDRKSRAIGEPQRGSYCLFKGVGPGMDTQP